MEAHLPAPAPVGRLRARLRAAGALAALAALVGGVPVLLVRVGTWPITGVPTADQLRDLPATMLTDDALLGVVTVLLWALWAVFALSVLVEVAAQLRHRRHTRRAGEAPVPPVDDRPRRVGGPVQALARHLVGSLMISAAPVLTLGRALPAGAAVPPATAAAVEVEAPAEAAPAVGAVEEATETDRPAATTVVTVQRGDTAWSLAERHLGDGARWREIWEANRDRVQPDGRTWADPDEDVHPGWVLHLPAAGAGSAADEPAPAEAGPPQALAGRPAGVPSEVVVQPGDNFWDLAEGQLAAAWGRAPADGEVVEHWQALVDANRDALVRPGDPDLIHPGQVFRVPAPPADPATSHALAGATPSEPTPAPAAPDCDPADADGDPATPPPSVADGTEAPATDPDPGGTPATAPDGGPGDPGDPVDGAAAGGDPDQGAPGDEPAAPDGEPVPAEEDPDAGVFVPGPAGPAEPPGGPDGGLAPDGLDDRASRSTGEAPAEPDPSDADDGPDRRAPVGLVGGGLALAGALLLLERRRRAQQRHRRRGRALPPPEPAERSAEQQLRWGADVAGARLLDAALRAAAAGAGATGLPRLAWAEAGGAEVVLVLDQPAPPPPGFVAADPDRWVTTATAEGLAAAGATAAAPLPALVPLGATDEGTELLVDLETSGVVTVAGSPDDVTGLLRALVVSLSTAPWGDQPRVVTVGLEPVLERLPGVEAAASLADALAVAEAHATATQAALRSLRGPSLAQARAVGATPEAWDPVVVVSAVPPAGELELRRLGDLARHPPAAVGLVVPPPTAGDLPGRGLVIDDHGWLLVEGVPEPVRPRHLGASEAAALVDLLAAAEQRRDVPTGPTVVELAPRRPVPPPPPPEPPVPGAGTDEVTAPAPDPAPEPVSGPVPPAPAPRAAAAGANGSRAARPRSRSRLAELMSGVEVLVRVLGEVSAVRLTGPASEGEPLVPTRQRALEAVTYLALRESAVDREDLEISLFPDGANAAKTIYNTVSSARRMLGDELFPPPEGGRYELSPAVVTDYGLFCELVAEADETEDALAAADLLHEALTLVRGEPFTGVGRSYAWVGPHRGMIVAQVVDAAEELAEVRLASGDWRAAEWAARQGLRAFPSDERMYRLLMRTARAAGNVPGVHRVFRELCDVLADPELGVEPEDTVHPETIELLEELTGTRPREGRLGA